MNLVCSQTKTLEALKGPTASTCTSTCSFHYFISNFSFNFPTLYCVLSACRSIRVASSPYIQSLVWYIHHFHRVGRHCSSPGRLCD